MNKPLRILILEDNAADAELMESELRKAELEFSARRVHSRDEFLKALADSPPELVLSDYAMPGFSGLEALKRLREQYADLPVIFVSGTIGEEEAVELMRLGATDFVPKTRLDKLVPAIQRALREMGQKEEKRRAETSLRESEARFRAVFEGASAGIAIEDLQGKILQTNRSLQQMLGYGAVELRRSPGGISPTRRTTRRRRRTSNACWPAVPTITRWKSGLCGGMAASSGDG